MKVLKSITDISRELPLILGFKDISSVASYLIDNSQGVVLNGYLIYAYKSNKTDLKSIIITVDPNLRFFILSEVYSNYKMIYYPFKYVELENYILSFKDNKDSLISESLYNRFYYDN